MKLKKALGIVLALAMVLTLAACGAAPAQETQAPETAAPAANAETTAAAAEPVNIVWAGWSGEEEASKDIFGRMMDTYREQTGNDVTWVGWTWADTAQQLLIRTQGGEQLDIAQVDIGIFNTVAAAGVLADWNEVVGADYMSQALSSPLWTWATLTVSSWACPGPWPPSPWFITPKSWLLPVGTRCR